MELLKILFSNGILTVLFLYLAFAGLSRLFQRRGEEADNRPPSPPPRGQRREEETREQVTQIGKITSTLQQEVKEPLISKTDRPIQENPPTLNSVKKKSPKHPLLSGLNRDSLKQGILMKEILDGPRSRRLGNRRGPLGR